MKKLFNLLLLLLCIKAQGTISYGAAGTLAQGTLSVNVPPPTGILANDLMIIGLATKYAEPTAISGWTLVITSNGGSGASGTDIGSVWTAVYYKIATSSVIDTVTITSSNAIAARMWRYTCSEGNTWEVTGTIGADNSPGTDVVITGASNIGYTAGDFYIFQGGLNTDLYTYTNPVFDVPGVTHLGTSARYNSGSSQGNDLHMWNYSNRISTGTATGVPSFSATASGTAADNPAGSGVFIRVKEITPLTRNRINLIFS